MNSVKFLQTVDTSPHKNIFSKGNVIVVHEKGEKSEGPVDGSFMFHLLISEYCGQSQKNFLDSSVVAASRKILLLLNHQTEKHWSTCCSKFGINLDSMKNAGNLIVLDTLKLQYNHLIQNDVEDCEPISAETEFKQLISQCTASIDSMYMPGNSQPSSASPKRLLIIIENLTSLFFSNATTKEKCSMKLILEFLRILRTHRKSEIDICIATLVKSDSNSWANDNNGGNYLANIATECLEAVTFEVAPLSTGFSEEINGKLLVKSNNKSYHYKIEDRNVKFISIL